ncbi:5-carboxymethyl-2-hydroxymuconate isomerase [Rhodobacterales bacterium HKCCE2091]|nr:5-carboxymethyl-2-hydroxymuconate isomerase [Rhodobacterales bacterium HKCCE2091]
MKLAAFLHGTETRTGIVDGDLIRFDDATPDFDTLLPALTSPSGPGIAGNSSVRLDDVVLLPPIPRPGKILCVATNFREPLQDKPAPDFPLMFTRFAESVTGHGAPILKPKVSEKYDFEGEMAAIIGRPGHKIPRHAAMDHVAGFSCFNDGSVRDWQKHSSQFTPGKNFHRSAGFGPWLVTPDELPSPERTRLTTRVNGVAKQDITFDRMIFDTAWLVAYISTFTPLAAGDVIVTGTPSGFGSTRKPPEFLVPGDVVEVEITGIGTLSNTVEQDDDPRGPIFSQQD